MYYKEKEIFCFRFISLTWTSQKCRCSLAPPLVLYRYCRAFSSDLIFFCLLSKEKVAPPGSLCPPSPRWDPAPQQTHTRLLADMFCSFINAPPPPPRPVGCRSGSPVEFGLLWKLGEPEPGVHQRHQCLCGAAHQTPVAQAAQSLVHTGAAPPPPKNRQMLSLTRISLTFHLPSAVWRRRAEVVIGAPGLPSGSEPVWDPRHGRRAGGSELWGNAQMQTPVVVLPRGSELHVLCILQRWRVCAAWTWTAPSWRPTPMRTSR